MLSSAVNTAPVTGSVALGPWGLEQPPPASWWREPGRRAKPRIWLGTGEAGINREESLGHWCLGELAVPECGEGSAPFCFLRTVYLFTSTGKEYVRQM